MNQALQATGGASGPLLQALRDVHADWLRGLPGAGLDWLQARRLRHLEAAWESGLPGARDERWRYTPLRALERTPRGLLPAHSAQATLPAALAALRIVFVDGHFDPAASSLAALPPGVEVVPLSRGAQLALDGDVSDCQAPDAEDLCWRRLVPEVPGGESADAFRNLNAALAADGLLLRVAAGTVVEHPLEVVFASSGAQPPGLWNLRNRIELGAGAALTLVERHVDAGGAGGHLGVLVSDLLLDAGAHLRHLRLHQAQASQRIAHTDVVVAERARYLPTVLESGAALSRHEWTVALTGAQAALLLRGLVLADGRQHVDTRLSVTHAVGATACDMAWRSIVGGRSRSAFHGGITIAPAADGSDAALQIRSLLLSADAAVDAQPVLEIHADEVKASHGAAIGQLDADALFYLRARGLPAALARRLLLQAFCAEMLTLQPMAATPDRGSGLPIGVRAADALAPALADLLDEALHRLSGAGIDA